MAHLKTARSGAKLAVVGLLLGAAMGWAVPGEPQALAPERLATVADVATSKKSFQVTPKTAPTYFGRLASLNSSRQGGTWRFSGPGTGPGVLWVVATFRRGEQADDWELRDAELGLTPVTSSGGSSFVALCREIGKRLRRPRFACQDNADRRVGWTVGRGRVGSLQEGAFDNPITPHRIPATLVRLQVLQGETD